MVNGRKKGDLRASSLSKSSTVPSPWRSITINHQRSTPVLFLPLPSPARILVAVSGGADSMALLHALQAQAGERGWQLTVAHLNHGIRGLAADEDARFVQHAATQLGLPCVVGRARVPALARRRGISIEMAAREARYAFLVRTARRVKAEMMVTAHTADDQTETLLLKLVRGAGRAGLSGIPAETTVQGLRLVRPLLEVPRGDILAYLRREKIAWREDESNADPVYLRNRVRHGLIPLLERDFNPRIRETLARTRRILSAEEDWLEELAGQVLKACQAGKVLSCRLLQAYPVAARRRVIRKWLIQQKVPESCLDFETTEKLMGLCARIGGSKTLLLGSGVAVRRTYDRLSIIQDALRGPVHFRVQLRVPGVTVLPEQGWRIVARLAPGLIKERAVHPGGLPARASLGLAGGKAPVLWVRSWRAGDKMIPFGMKGTKKIQDILVDAKLPQSERRGIPLFESSGKIVWLPGYRIAASWAVKDPKAQNLQLSLEKVRG